MQRRGPHTLGGPAPRSRHALLAPVARYLAARRATRIEPASLLRSE
jgi:hypothetical protein